MSFPVAVALLLFGVVCISGNSVFSEIARGQYGLGPTAGAFWRCLIAATTVGVMLPWLGGGKESLRDKSGLFWAFLGGLGFAADLGALHWGYAFEPVARVTLLANVAVIPVATYAWFALGERPRPVFFVGVGLAFAGLVVLLGPGAAGGDRWPHLWLGDLLGVTIIFSYAGYQIGVKLARRTLAAWPTIFVVSVAASAGLAAATATTGEAWLPEGGAVAWWPVLGMAWVAHLGGQGAIMTAFKYLPAGFASAMLLTQPVVVALFGWIFLGQGLGVTESAGATVVLFGLFCAVLGREK